MDLNLLQIFVEVADAGGFAAAARNLGVQRSSVSRSVAQLEEQTGVQLFHRTTRQVSLTSAGQALYARVSENVAALADAMATVPESDDEPSGLVRLTVPNDIAVHVLPHALAGFTRRFPRVQVYVDATNRYVDLVGETYDAALRPGARRLPDSPLVARRLSPVRMTVYGAPDYLARAGTPQTEDEARSHRWVIGPTQGSAGDNALEHAVEGNDLLFALGCAREGLGLVRLPSFVASRDVLAGRLIRVFPEGDEEHYIYFVHPAHSTMPSKLSALREYLTEYFAARPLT